MCSMMVVVLVLEIQIVYWPGKMSLITSNIFMSERGSLTIILNITTFSTVTKVH